MQDDYLSTPQAVRRGMSGRAIAALFAAALLLGAIGTAWVSWHFGWLDIDAAVLGGEPAPQPVAALPTPAAPRLAPDASVKLSALEARIAELDQEAEAASGNANRAEGLLIAFAARRAIERGQPLGYLENQLRLRFGATQPQSVDRIIKAQARPVTLGQLSEQLAILEPVLDKSTPDEGTWDWISREASELFIIRHTDSPSPAPEKRLARARQYLAGGQVEAAMDEVRRMPGAGAAKDWLASAQDYVLTGRALDIIENAAVLQPQAGSAAPRPVAAPAASAAPTPAPAP